MQKIKQKISFLTRLSANQERDYFIENLSMLTESGMDVLAALVAIKEDVRSKGMKEIIDFMISEIESGSTLWRALDKTKLAPDQVIALVRVGEESGRLAQNLSVVALQQEKDRAFKSKIRSAMMYPVLVLIITFVIAIGIAWFILPRLSSVFSQLNVELPLVTRILIAVGEFLKAYGSFVIPIIIVGFFGGLYFIFAFKKTKFIGQEILFAIPPIRKLVREIELARFGYVLGTLISAGLPIVAALQSLSRSASFRRYKNLYTHVAKKVDEGFSVSNSFKSYKNISIFIPTPVQHLIASGEQSGTLSKTLEKIGRTYEVKIDDTTKNLSTLLEPILLVIVWLGVVGVAVAVILPIYSLIQGVSQ